MGKESSIGGRFFSKKKIREERPQNKGGGRRAHQRGPGRSKRRAGERSEHKTRPPHRPGKGARRRSDDRRARTATTEGAGGARSTGAGASN